MNCSKRFFHSTYQDGVDAFITYRDPMFYELCVSNGVLAVSTSSVKVLEWTTNTMPGRFVDTYVWTFLCSRN